MLSVVVVGAGRIGSTNDRDNPVEPLSHIGAILRTDGLELLAVVERSETARDSAAKQWRAASSAPFLATMDELRSDPDIVSVCVPTTHHRDAITEAVKRNPKLLIVEKPFAASLEQAQELDDLCRDKGIALRVNYNRRFDPGTIAFEHSLDGLPAKAVLLYGKGVFNYASHMVDLMLSWFGPVQSVQAPTPASIEGNADRNIDFRCHMTQGFDAYFVGIDGLQYDQFEIDLFFPERLARYSYGGVRRSVAVPVKDLYYRGYAHLEEVPESLSVGRVAGFRQLYQAAAACLGRGEPMPGCDGPGAVAVHRVIDAALESGRQGGREILLDDGDAHEK
jgi:predicted dehydrogenase